MDVLNDIVDTLQLKGALYFRTDFTPPWAIAVPAYQSAARFHLVVQGRFYATLSSGASVELNVGDMILIPAGARHTISSAPEEHAAPLENVMAEAGYGGDGVFTLGDGDPSASVRLICGHFTFRPGADHPLLRALPEYLIVTSSLRAKHSWLDEVLRLIVRQLIAESENSAATITRLSEVVFIETLRACTDQSPKLALVVGALKGRRIGEALLLMHERLDEQWTLERLATNVGMSRSRFAEQFREAVGCGPMTYLTEWRIQKAINLLTASQLNVQQIAAKTGYQSPAAFTRAFSQKTGCSPTAYRRLDSATVH